MHGVPLGVDVDEDGPGPLDAGSTSRLGHIQDRLGPDPRGLVHTAPGSGPLGSGRGGESGRPAACGR